MRYYAMILPFCALLLMPLPAISGSGGGGGVDVEDVDEEDIDKRLDDILPTPWQAPEEWPDWDDLSPTDQEKAFKKFRQERLRRKHVLTEAMAQAAMGF